MGHLNGIFARVGGNLNNNFQKSQMPGGMLKLRFDRYIIKRECFNLLDHAYKFYSGLSKELKPPSVVISTT